MKTGGEPIDRRTLIAGGLAGTAASLLPGTAGGITRTPPLIAQIERRTFDWFWHTTNHANGLVPDRWPTPSFCSIAAVGFGLTAWGIGAERGWVTRAAARDLTLTTLRFFAALPTGDAPSGTAGHRGFFYHFLDMRTGLRYRDTELSSVDTTLLFLGMLFAGAYFDRDDAAEREIRRRSAAVVDRADWGWFLRGRDTLSMGWHPGAGFIDRSWDGYNEGMMVVLLGLGASAHPLPGDAWAAWTRTYPAFWRGAGPTRHIAFAPLFGHQYSQMWIDFRGIRDAPMRAAGFDYFENTRRATYADRAYCIANPMRWTGYGRDLWGLTACDGPGNFPHAFAGEQRTFYGYSARGPVGQPDGRDDGTLAPTAALGSLPYAPEIVLPAAQALARVPGLYGRYGFKDAFNSSVTWADVKLETGTVDPCHGWVATDHLGIDQGPILGGIANWRDGFVWRVMRRSAVVRRGLQRAGFTGGWLARG